MLRRNIIAAGNRTQRRRHSALKHKRAWTMMQP
jgi:hypothetical protein